MKPCGSSSCREACRECTAPEDRTGENQCSASPGRLLFVARAAGFGECGLRDLRVSGLRL